MKIQMGLCLTWLIALPTAAFAAFPRPAVVQQPTEWTLSVQFQQPRQLSVRVPGQEKPQRFWYLILTVTNNSDRSAVPFVPKCELVTDTFEVMPAGHRIPKGVYETIRRKYQGRYPFLESMDFEDNRIHQGPDNTRDFVIIWRDFNPTAKEVNFFIAGMSNETTVLTHPTRTDEDGNPIRVFLQKTLQLRYKVGADPRQRDRARLELVEQNWVMR